MIKLEIRLDDTLIKAGTKLTTADIYNAIDKVFSKYDFNKSELPDGTVCYSGKGASSDFGAFANLVLFLRKKEWFMPYADKWLWYNSDDGLNEEDFVVEDILYHYASRRSLA